MIAKDYHILKTENDVIAVLGMLDTLGIPCKWSGLCIWAEPRNDKDALTLHGIGAKWSAKRQAWYLRGAEGIGKHIGVASC